MASEFIRFLHASDFHLERPLYGLPAVPDHLRDLLIDAPFTAATRVFDCALQEQVDFLVLAGDIFDSATAGPRAIAFLLEQFERLKEKGIAVYWAGGKVDPPEAWPTAVPLPGNVYVFGAGKVDELTHLRDQAHATIIGVSWSDRHRLQSAEFRVTSTNHFRLAVAYGQYDPNALVKQNIHYWALGGDHQRKTLFANPQTAHYAGTPQGRNPDEAGPHGCTLVNVDPDGKIRTQLIPTDAVRWHNERLDVSDAATRGDVQRVMRERLQVLANEAGERCLLVAWTLDGAARLGGALRHGGLAEELLSDLRTEFGHRRNAAWSLSLDLEPPTQLPPEWYEEDSILGDFLRAVRERDSDDSGPLQLSTYLSDEQATSVLGSALALPDTTTRVRVLREAAMLGVDLLRGDG